MNCYFLRHGIAADPHEWRGSDDDRPLTPDGVKRMEREAQGIARLSLDIERIVTSPLLRAQQTAEIVAQRLGLGGDLVEDARLAHGFNVSALQSILSENAGVQTIILVGHEPTMSTTIGRIAGDANIELKKGALAGLELAENDAESGILVCLFPPKALVALGKR